MSFIGARFIGSGFIGRIGSLWHSRATYGDDSLVALAPSTSIMVLSTSNVFTTVELEDQEAPGAVLAAQAESAVSVEESGLAAVSLPVGDSGVLIDSDVSEVHDG